MAVSDVVVLLPGISGSTLSKDGKVVWGADLGGIWRVIKSGGDSIRSLALTHGDDPAEDDIDGVEATSLIPDLHLIPGLWKIDGYSKVGNCLVERLKLKRGQNFFEFPYDWRRDNRVASRKLGLFARQKLKAWRETSGATGAKLVFVAHSMGGLVARGFMDGPDEGWRDTRALITLGTPHRGSLNALGYLANGFTKGVGPLRLDLADTMRTFTGLYQLLPRYPCIDRGDSKLLRVSETPGLPNIDPGRAKASLEFYEDLERSHMRSAAQLDYDAQAPRWFPVMGTFQPTKQSAQFGGESLALLETRCGKDDGGDGTVPRASATPMHMADEWVGMLANQLHGSLQNDDAVLEHVVAVVAGLDIKFSSYRAKFEVALDLADVYAADAPVTLRAKAEPAVSTLELDLYDASEPAGRETVRLGQITLHETGDGGLAKEVSLGEGAYRVVAGGTASVAPVADCFMVVGGGL